MIEDNSNIGFIYDLQKLGHPKVLIFGRETLLLNDETFDFNAIVFGINLSSYVLIVV